MNENMFSYWRFKLVVQGEHPRLRMKNIFVYVNTVFLYIVMAAKIVYVQGEHPRVKLENIYNILGVLIKYIPSSGANTPESEI